MRDDRACLWRDKRVDTNQEVNWLHGQAGFRGISLEKKDRENRLPVALKNHSPLQTNHSLFLWREGIDKRQLKTTDNIMNGFSVETNI